MTPIRIALYSCVVSLVALSSPMLVRAADPPTPEQNTVLSGEQIEQALHPPAATTRGFPSRGLSRRDTAEHQQSVNLNVPFDSNSSALTSQASAQLAQLEMALNSATLGKDRFMVAGHTDAKAARNTTSYSRSGAPKR